MSTPPRRRVPASLISLMMALSASAQTGDTNSPAPPIPLPPPHQWWFTVRWENDKFGGTDRYYTDGVSLSLIHTGGGWLDSLADHLPWSEGRRSVGYDVAQIMINPADETLKIPPSNDRPYAGILLGGISLHIDKGNTYQGFKIMGGLLGPWSQADVTQRQIHRWVKTDLPMGWDYQLQNEPILNLVYEQRRKYRLLGDARGPAVEALPIATAMLGNMLTQAQLGGQVRVGYNIPDDFGKSLLRGMGLLPPSRGGDDPPTQPAFGIYFYGGIHGSVVLRNITLDGNTWKDSPSVDKETLVPSAEIGMAVAMRRVVVAFSYVFIGREFKGPADTSEFGALTASYRF